MQSSQQNTPSMFWRVLIGGFSVLMTLSILAIAVFQFEGPKKWLINSVLLPRRHYINWFEKATGFFPFNAKISHLSILNQDSTARLQSLSFSELSYVWKLTGLVNGYMEFPFLNLKGVSAQINGAMTSGTAYDEAIDSVSIDLNNGFDFIITELSVGIDSMVIKPSTTDLGIPMSSADETSFFFLKTRLCLMGVELPLGFKKKKGLF